MHLTHRYPSLQRSVLAPIGEASRAMRLQAVAKHHAHPWAPPTPIAFWHFALHLMTFLDDAPRTNRPPSSLAL